MVGEGRYKVGRGQVDSGGSYIVNGGQIQSWGGVTKLGGRYNVGGTRYRTVVNGGRGVCLEVLVVSASGGWVTKQTCA